MRSLGTVENVEGGATHERAEPRCGGRIETRINNENNSFYFGCGVDGGGGCRTGVMGDIVGGAGVWLL